MLKPSQAWLAICLAAALSTQAAPSLVQVTFRVNMEYQELLGNFTPGSGSVQVRGPFTDWANNGLTLTNLPGTSFYQNVANIMGTEGEIVAYKFWHSGAGTGDVWESGDNRTITLAGETMEVYRYFNDEWSGGTPVPITFRVSLQPQIQNGAYNPDADAIEARGSFQDAPWTSPGLVLTNAPGDPTVYSGTYDVTRIPPGAPIYYKFVIVTNNVYGQDRWESDPNRSFTMPTQPATVPLDTFNREVATGINVEFQVDLGYAPDFDPALDQVEARGSFQVPNTWSGGFQLTNSPANPYIYSGTYTVYQAPGTPFEYKFLILDDGTSERWEGIGNRSFVLAATNQELPLVTFNNVRTSDILSEDTVVTFRVNMTNAAGYGGGIVFDPALHNLYINGDWVPWWDWNQVPPSEYQLTNNVDGSLIYSQSFVIPKGNPLRIVYKYAISGYDNEAAPFNDRVRYIRSTGEYVMPLDVFGDMVQEPEMGDLQIRRSGPGEVTLTWLGHPAVRLQQAPSLAGPWSDVPNSIGDSELTVPTSASQQYYRLMKP